MIDMTTVNAMFAGATIALAGVVCGAVYQNHRITRRLQILHLARLHNELEKASAAHDEVACPTIGLDKLSQFKKSRLPGSPPFGH